MNSTITADLPRRTPPVRHPKLPASQRCIGLLNGEASYPGKGCGSDITTSSSYDDCPAGIVSPAILKAGKSSKTQPFFSVS